MVLPPAVLPTSTRSWTSWKVSTTTNDTAARWGGEGSAKGYILLARLVNLRMPQVSFGLLSWNHCHKSLRTARVMRMGPESPLRELDGVVGWFWGLQTWNRSLCARLDLQ